MTIKTTVTHRASIGSITARVSGDAVEIHEDRDLGRHVSCMIYHVSIPLSDARKFVLDLIALLDLEEAANPTTPPEKPVEASSWTGR